MKLSELEKRGWLGAVESTCALYSTTPLIAFEPGRRLHDAARRAVYVCLVTYHGASSAELGKVFGRDAAGIRRAIRRERAVRGLRVEKKGGSKPYTDGLLQGRLGERDRVARYLRLIGARLSDSIFGAVARKVESGDYLDELARAEGRRFNPRRLR